MGAGMFKLDVEVLRRVHNDICDHLPRHEITKRTNVAVALLEGARDGISVQDLFIKARIALEMSHV